MYLSESWNAWIPLEIWPFASIPFQESKVSNYKSKSEEFGLLSMQVFSEKQE